MDIAKRYAPNKVEEKWYDYWERKGYFHSEPDEREPFTIVIPPPNVTGVLHMGHMLNNTIQDILIRKARQDGKNACWVPGTDHASIATEAKVVRMLREKGIKKSDLTREEFIDYAWEWKNKYGGLILKQLRKLGASCDWERTAFTMDEIRSEAVLQVFVDLYNKGKLYRGHRMVNWDPEAKTVLSNEEVIYNDEETRLYHVSYHIQDSKQSITIATTRPETILGDTAIAVHPDDERYRKVIGKKVLVPLLDRPIPIIADDYVDREFGTGALKITPAHDPNDYDIGKRHDLEVIDVLNEDGAIAAAGQILVGMDRDKARIAMVEKLREAGQLVKEENYTHSVGRSERTNCVVEPRLSLQWYIDMEKLAGPALKAVEKDEIAFIPKKYKNIYRHWIENIRDWCISRQLWWGQRIPAYYLDRDGEEKVYVALSMEEALQQAIKETGDASLTAGDLHQDEDVVDTWFSSWLWPITVFDGFNGSEDFRYYYPTSVLVTAWDIIFLWVARMIMAGYEWKNERPFNQVYFTGMVRDKQRRKMSKSLGNSPDALKLIDTYGADGVRFGVLSSSPAGGDLLFDEKLCEQGRNFSNKVWNALRLVKGWENNISEDAAISPEEQYAMQWFQALLARTIEEINEKFNGFRLSEAIMQLYTFVWDDFCSWYLELVKVKQDVTISRKVFETTIGFFEQICSLLHPFMPFITEEIWHMLKERGEGEDCMISVYPSPAPADNADEILKAHEALKVIITKVREQRAQYQIPNREAISLFFADSDLTRLYFSMDGFKEAVMKLTNLEKCDGAGEETEGMLQFVAWNIQFFIPLEQQLNLEEECERLKKELDYARGFVRSVEKKLGNERFVQNAPADVVEKERKKLSDGQETIALLEESLKNLGCE